MAKYLKFLTQDYYHLQLKEQTLLKLIYQILQSIIFKME